MNYRPDVDGLRAIAVIPVVFYHAGLAGISGGFVGVDVFFVISGYLITRIIHDEMLEQRFSILHFYERRARRILPALFTVMTVTLAMGWYWLAPSEYDALARAAGSVLAFLSNVWFWRNSGGYFDGATDYLPLLHTWSLAVEEQFYILFPLLLLGLVRLGVRVTQLVTLAMVTVSLALAVWATPQMPSASFYLLPTRFWELGVGSLLAIGLAPNTAPRLLREGVAATGLAAILYAVIVYDDSTVFPGLAAIPPVLGAAGLIWAGGAGGSFANRALALRPVVFVGLLSYSLYLWHWPIMAFARNLLMDLHLPPVWQAGTIALSLLLAFVSWRLVERPFRSTASRGMSRMTVFAASGAGLVAVGTIALFIAVTGGAATQRFDAIRLAAYHAVVDRSPRDWTCGGGIVERCAFEVSQYGDDTAWAIWGDSHAGVLLPAVLAVASEQNRAVYLVGKGGCPPLPGLSRSDMPLSENVACEALNQEALRILRSELNIDTVFLAARWPIYVEGTWIASEGRGTIEMVSDPAADQPIDNRDAVAAALETVVVQLREAGLQVVLLGPVPEMPWDVTARLQAAVLFDFALPENIPDLPALEARLSGSNAILSGLAERIEGVAFIPIAPILCKPDCRLSDDGVPRYSDNNHLTQHGAREILAPALQMLFP